MRDSEMAQHAFNGRIQQHPFHGGQGHLYPPEQSTSNLSLITTINEGDREKYLLSSSEALASQEQPVKKGWTHKSINTAFGPLNVRMFLKKSWIKWYIILAVISVLVILMTIYHHQIVTWMEPWANKLEKLPGGWAIPIGIMFVISFPPLFGHEIVAVLCGVVWGLWVGFGIVAAGTLLGEIGNFYAFKWCLTGRADKLAKSDINYACMVKTVEEGGFWIAFIARLSAIPGHLTTGVFATCGMSFWTFLLATFLTLPKQLQVVYLGTIFDQEEDQKSTLSKVITNTVLVLSFIVTIVAAWYIYKKMAKFRPIVEAEWAERARLETAFVSGSAQIGPPQMRQTFNSTDAILYQQSRNKSDAALLTQETQKDAHTVQYIPYSRSQEANPTFSELPQGQHPYAVQTSVTPRSIQGSGQEIDERFQQQPRQAPQPPSGQQSQTPARDQQQFPQDGYRIHNSHPSRQTQPQQYSQSDTHARQQAYQYVERHPYQYQNRQSSSAVNGEQHRDQKTSHSPSTSRQPISTLWNAATNPEHSQPTYHYSLSEQQQQYPQAMSSPHPLEYNSHSYIVPSPPLAPDPYPPYSQPHR